MLLNKISRQQAGIIITSWLGWSFAAYDLTLMILVIPAISVVFFHSDDLTLNVSVTFLIFIVTLLMRPVGGAIFGNMADRYGRKKVMAITILGFSICTFVTGLLPDYQQIGFFAPILLLIVRIIQGLFAGGEWGSSSVITIESIQKDVRGLISGFIQSGFAFGLLLASVTFGLVLSIYPPGEAFNSIGWRILFFTGIIPGLLTLFIRFKVNESKVWIQHPKDKIEKHPFKKLLQEKEERKRFFLGLILLTGLLYNDYGILSFIPSMLHRDLQLEPNDIFNTMIVVSIFSLFGTILCGFISQHIGRMKSIMIFAIASIIFTIPLSIGLFSAGISRHIIEVAIFAGLLSFLGRSGLGPIPAFLTERFPTQIRTSAAGFVYNSGLIIGAWAPLIAVSLLSHADNSIRPYLFAVIIIVGSIMIFIGTKVNPETYQISDLSR